MNATTRILIMIAAAIILLTPAAFSQNQPDRNNRGQRGFDPQQIIDRRIQFYKEQLKITPDQEKKIRAIMEKNFQNRPQRNGAPGQNNAASSRRDRLAQDRSQNNRQNPANAEIRKVLTPEQQKKFDALPQQGRGFGGRGMSVDDRVKGMADRLKLTADQQKKLRAIYERQGEEMRKAFEQMGQQRGQNEDRDARREQFQKMQEKYNKEVEALLTAPQKKEFAAMRQEMMQRMQQRGNGDQRGGNNGRGQR